MHSNSENFMSRLPPETQTAWRRYCQLVATALPSPQSDLRALFREIQLALEDGSPRPQDLTLRELFGTIVDVVRTSRSVSGLRERLVLGELTDRSRGRSRERARTVSSIACSAASSRVVRSSNRAASPSRHAR